MSYLQNFNFAWGVGIFSGEERSEIRRFLGKVQELPGMAGEKLKHDGVRIFPEFPPWRRGFS